MASFYAELTIEGQTYPVRQCQYEFRQATDGRGRAQARVRHGLVHLVLDVPADGQLLAWAATPHKPLPGHVTFFAADQRTASETLGFAAAECVGYHESFVAGDPDAGAYVCQLTLACPALTLAAGGAGGAYVPAAAREYAAPAAAVAGVAAATPTVVEPTKQQRYDARMGLMQDARTKLAATPDEAAETALTRLARNNVAVERAKLSAHVYQSDKVPPVPPPEG